VSSINNVTQFSINFVNPSSILSRLLVLSVLSLQNPWHPLPLRPWTITQITRRPSLIVTFFLNFRYILYVSSVDQAANVEDRRTSMAIVEVRIEGSLEDRPKPNPTESQVATTSSSDELSNETEEFLREAKRRVRANIL